MKDRSDDPSHHERTLLPQSYIFQAEMLINDQPVIFQIDCGASMNVIQAYFNSNFMQYYTSHVEQDCSSAKRENSTSYSQS